MDSAFGAILRFLGAILNGIYQVIPSYGVAIILLTILVRLVLFPLAVKQIRSMTSMQRIQPKLKELQKKHKGDRQKLNEEMMKLYKEHGVNPLGGCFPMLLQMPVFIALYAVIRSAVAFDAAVVPQTVTIPITKATVCRPVGSGNGASVSEVKCVTGSESQTFVIASTAGSVSRIHSTERADALPGYVTSCPVPKGMKKGVEINQLRCQSPLGTGHLPADGKLTKALVVDKATFLGMHLACSPTQATSKTAIRQCTGAEDAGGVGPGLVMYYALVLLMAGTTFYQQKQMLSRQAAGSAQAQQMVLMSKIMPVFMGFLSLNFPAALSLYWVVGNFWMIGQQHFILKAQGGPDGAMPAIDAKAGKPKPVGGNGSSNGRSGGKPSGKSGKPGKKPQGKSGKRR